MQNIYRTVNSATTLCHASTHLGHRQHRHDGQHLVRAAVVRRRQEHLRQLGVQRELAHLVAEVLLSNTHKQVHVLNKQQKALVLALQYVGRLSRYWCTHEIKKSKIDKGKPQCFWNVFLWLQKCCVYLCWRSPVPARRTRHPTLWCLIIKNKINQREIGDTTGDAISRFCRRKHRLPNLDQTHRFWLSGPRPAVLCTLNLSKRPRKRLQETHTARAVRRYGVDTKKKTLAVDTKNKTKN